MNDTLRRQPARPLLVAVGAALLVAALGVPLAPHLPAIATDESDTMPLAPELPRSVTFEVNEGQAAEDVAYIARAGAHRAEIFEDGSLGIESATPLRLTPVGASASAASATGPGHTVNYLHGNDSTEWQTGIQTFGEVRFGDVYAGTDLVYHGRRGELEYDFVLRPGADASDISLAFEGAETLEIARNGDLLVRTATGTLRQKAPIAFQQKQSIEVEYALQGGNRFGFDVSAYDHSKKLTIDPILKLGTLLGGDSDDTANGIAVGSDGSIYVAGDTTSTDFPTKDGFPILPVNGDAYVSKFAPNGKSLIWSTYIGGTDFDGATDLVLDGARVFLTGFTYSDDFPLGTDGTPSQGGRAGESDAFFLILAGDGQAIDYGTYYGGTSFDSGLSIARDASYAYILGGTLSDDLPVPHGYQPAFAGAEDTFLAKFDVQVAGEGPLEYATYLGGTGIDYADSGGTIFVRAGLAFIVGSTDSDDFPMKAGHDTSFGGDTDAFFSVLDPSQEGADSFVHSTYVGGSNDDSADGLTLDSAGNVYIGGETESANFPTTSGAFDKAPSREEDGWLIKLRSTGFTKAFLTLLGGSGDDEAEDVAVDEAGNIYVVAESESANFPTTVDRLAKGTNDKDQMTATKFNKTGSKIIWSTAFGGAEDQVAESLFFKGGDLYIAGETDISIPTTKGAFQRQPGDSDNANDVFVVRLAPSKFHARKVSLTLTGHLKAKGKVTVRDGANVCRSSVPVKLQRKVAGKWKTVATGKTNFIGETEKNLADMPGEYRALAPLVKKQANAHICNAAKSTVKSHKH